MKAHTHLELDSNLQPLHLAALSGHTDIVELLLQTNQANGDHAEIDCLCSEDQQSPLHCAASRGHCDVVSLLLAHDSNVNIRNGSAATPLHHAAMNNHVAVVSLLLKASADPLAVAKNNWTPILMAFRQGHTECGHLIEACCRQGGQRSAPSLVQQQQNSPRLQQQQQQNSPHLQQQQQQSLAGAEQIEFGEQLLNSSAPGGYQHSPREAPPLADPSP
eukprot:TRINITY_DN8858_c0_g1_i1.p1 TRINITY_DN8858_c0_g1~~TRINITY_DN8858_c0_g1_i1.p1  ORF type:complete len:218 (-),score=51.71 TRINITY_DN8858_c0_g1_i1:83-736(-)